MKKNAILVSVNRGVILFLIPLNILLSVFSMFSWYYLRQQALDNYSASVRMTVLQADSSLHRLQEWNANLFYTRDEFRLMRLSGSNVERFLAAKKINTEASTYLSVYPYGMIYFVRCGENLHIPVANSLTTQESNVHISDFIRNIDVTAETQPMGSYFPTQLGSQWFLALYLRQQDVYAGMLVNVADYMRMLEFSGIAVTSCTLEGADGTVLFSSGQSGRRDVQLRTFFENAPLTLVVTLPEDVLLGRFQALTTLSFILAFLALGLMVSYFVYTRRQVVIPLQKLQETINKIKEGNTEQKIDITGEKDEIAQVYQVFNDLIENIVHLKLESYENRIARQQTELQYLRLQLRPHFFLNSLKRIYALAQDGQTEEIQEYLLCLANHYRFLIYDTTNTISLQDEIHHVRNYIQLQRIGYHLTIDCKVTMEANPALLQVPPLIIQSFVENSIKYAVSPGKPLMITIQARILPSEEGDSLNIVCTDNGPGFPPNDIEDIANGSGEFGKKHVGFNNLKHRLALIYHRASYIYVYNQPSGGAVVDIIIPVESPHALPDRKEEL